MRSIQVHSKDAKLLTQKKIDELKSKTLLKKLISKDATMKPDHEKLANELFTAMTKSTKSLEAVSQTLKECMFKRITVIGMLKNWSVERSTKKNKKYLVAEVMGLSSIPTIRVVCWGAPEKFCIPKKLEDIYIFHNCFLNNEIDNKTKAKLHNKAVLVADEATIWKEFSPILIQNMQPFLKEMAKTKTENVPQSCMIIFPLHKYDNITQ